MRYLNDITASQADFVVSDQDYAGTLRQVMFDAMTQLAGRMEPSTAMRLMTLAMDYSDLPNHEQMAEEMRKLTGERDPDKPLTPEEQQQMQQQMQAQAEALQMQQESARQALAEQQAKVREINARAEKLEAEAEQMRAAGGNQALAQQMDGVAATVRQDADAELEAMSRKLAKAQSDLANKTLQIKADQDVRLQVARIEADSRERVAQIQTASRERLDAVGAQLDRFPSKTTTTDSQPAAEE